VIITPSGFEDGFRTARRVPAAKDRGKVRLSVPDWSPGSSPARVVFVIVSRSRVLLHPDVSG
jgi:hypothetical protein